MDLREDLVFATCHQLAGAIKGDWDDAFKNDEVFRAIKVLEACDEPDTNIDNKMLQVALIKLSIESMKVILQHADGWTTEEADIIKKEIVYRVRTYERRITQLTSPLLDLGPFELSA